ncbi:phosphotransferase enzyme family protein [Streptomyces tsukubensis]|uniref:Aminoglycoside phosphotransferase domain-containing protein n=1 Tax=Streptomyces tsukubensis TaxID=83656 RepID=A0A1V4A6U6_9ACTN|nr:aminoglycoside phosphotransferase family protein [Streptomyces tsukubensis]OON77309.1 hypothetical protein B1H18_18870 [Streptomyces tsukubensis]QFR92384.1 phosphotransferase [Streptomyces tsukubensis]
MTEDTRTLTPSVRIFAEGVLGRIAAVHDASRPGPHSRVWEVTRADGRRFYVKRSPTPKSFERETWAYRSAVPALGFGRAPHLLGSDARQLTLLLTALPGAPVTRVALDPAARRAAHRQFGAVLARLHSTGAASAVDRRRALESAHALPDEAELNLRRAGSLIAGERAALVRRAAARAVRLAPGLPAARVHGDAREHNALWHEGRLALIDFERSRYAPAALDFVRLACGPWEERADLRTAFFEGYGRRPTEAEREALWCMAVLDAVSRLGHGPSDGDEATRRGLRTLERLERGAFG